MTRRQKKEREEATLEKIYDPASLASLESSERPDFRLSKSSEQKPFGVEVTDLYYTETDARLQNIGGYISELLEGGDFRHKDDPDVIDVSEIAIHSPDGEIKARSTAVIRELPAVDEYIDLIVERIREKGGRYGSIDPQLTHVNLVIDDREARLSTVDIEGFYRLCWTEKLERAVAQSPFQEIFFITEVKERGEVYLPLRTVYLLAAARTFVDAAFEYDPRLFMTAAK